MSLLDIARARGRHRHLSAAELLAELVATRRQKDGATIAAIKYATLAEERQRQLDEAGITISGLLIDLETAREEGIRLQSALDNATHVTVVASWTRDISPGDEPTHPQGLDVRQLRTEYGTASTSPAEYAPMRLSAAAEAGLL